MVFFEERARWEQRAGAVSTGPGNGVGIRNDWAKSNKVVDTGTRFVLAGSEGEAEAVGEPPWLSYQSKWGPTKQYDTAAEARKVRKLMPGKLKKEFDKLVKVIDEVYGMDGPTGPKTRRTMQDHKPCVNNLQAQLNWEDTFRRFNRLDVGIKSIQYIETNHWPS
ncbi:hypothetical protein SASPL_127815 [Salvia splendens]|uniref:Uncharacterized protein n=1 Tax=Salvia splendens TaxID=180675 RepID=A0A8X8XCV2_SALSN|nr:hypothetical protein SASPL_127815 [Salvia splendens]